MKLGRYGQAVEERAFTDRILAGIIQHVPIEYDREVCQFGPDYLVSTA
jgi:hypothetical protein